MAFALPRPVAALIDFALPPRCPGCGAVVDGDDRFCLDCWRALDWLDGGCAGCGLPLAGGPSDPGARCGACLAAPPRHDGIRAAVAYGPIAARVAMKLKYGRKPGVAKTIAQALARHVDTGEAPLLVPVPLHRWRLWSRGFNQSALIAARLGRMTGAEVAPQLLMRPRATPVLRGLGARARAKALKGAIAIDPTRAAAARDRVILLIDDVHTSGATADACTRALKRAGAARVVLLCWARVLPGGIEGR